MSDSIIYGVEGESEAFASAVASARTTFKFFWRELSWEARRVVKSLDMAAVKLSFPVDDNDPDVPSLEHMWVTHVEFDGETLSGTLMNEPRWVKTAKASEHVSLPFSALNDWMYVRDGHVFGGFTVDALRSQMSDAERAEHDGAWGLDFGPPGSVEVVPAAEGREPWLLSTGLADEQDRQTLSELERVEHPMSLNMRDKVEQGLQDHPEVTHELDESGWSLLHREVLAGNYTVVRSLLRHGADPLAPTVDGRTALALADRAGWPRITALLHGNDDYIEPDYAPAPTSQGFPLWPIGLAMVVVALGWIYYLLVDPIGRGSGSYASILQSDYGYFAATLLLGFGIVSCTGPWYFRLRERTPRAGNSRVLDLVGIVVAGLVAYVLKAYVRGVVMGG